MIGSPGKKTLLVTIAVSLCVVHLTAQPYYFKHYQPDNGLSNYSVLSCLQDEDGFLWFGTIDGLNRFDGYTFKTFHHEPGDSTSIGSNFIRCLYGDNRHKLWIGTDKGIYTYDKLTEKFSRFRLAPAGGCAQIKSDGLGRYWFIIDMALYSYQAGTGRVRTYRLDGSAPVATSIAFSDEGSLWVSTSRGSIMKYRPSLDSFVTYSIYSKKSGQLPTSIEKIFPINKDSFLVGTDREGVKLFDTRTKQYKDIVVWNEKSSGVFVHEFIKKDENEYWIGTETGIYIYRPREDHVIHLGKEFDNPYSLSDNVVSSFCRDREGGIWVGTYLGGINFLPSQYLSFRKFFPQTGVPSLKGNAVEEISKDQYGNFWVGTEDGGVNEVNLKTNTFTNFVPTGKKGSIAYHNIHGLLASGSEVWIGSFEHGLDVLDIPSGKVIRHYQAGMGKHDLKSNFIISIYETRDGQKYIGTKKGLFRYNKSQDNFTAIKGIDGTINALFEDDQGVIWCCTQGEGVYYFQPQTGQYVNLKYDSNSANSLIDNNVTGVLQDHRKNFWFATKGGLCRYEMARGKFIRFTTKDGLPDNFIFRILEDSSDNLWISTAKGLVCFNPDARSIKVYRKADGLLSDQFNYNSAFKDKDGRMYFGGLKGMISFNPAQINENHSIPPVFITGIQVNNRELVPDSDHSTMPLAATYTKHISLPCDQSTLIIDFASLSFTAPETNEYAYRMEGLEHEWTYLPTNRKVYFTKLPPGDYTFRVKGSNSSGVWNNKEADLEIHISPSLWASNPAKAIYLILSVALAYIIMRLYALRTNEKNTRKIEVLEMEKEREIYHAKIEFFTNIAHEIRTPLTLIKMPLDKLMKKENHLPEVKANLRVMEKNTNRLIDLTNQLLDFRKTESGKFSLNFVKTDVTDQLREIYSSFMPAADEKNLVYKLDMPWIALQASVDQEAFKKIVSNLICNAIKYAKSKVTVHLLPFSSQDKVFTIEVRNDGFLVPYNEKEKIFEPFYRLKETEKESGSGIGLALSRSLAESHKGILDLKKPEHGMNIFHLMLPIHQEKAFDLQQSEPGEHSAVVVDEPQEPYDESRPSILFVEDNKEIIDFVCRDLQSAYAVRKAHNGLEALSIMEEENISLVVSDIMMPVMDGLELCSKIKSNLKYSHIPIVLLTAKNTLHSKIEGLEMGADAYIEKPFSYEHLTAQISNLLSNRSKMKEYFASSPLAHIKTMGCSKADESFLEQLDQVIQENLTNVEMDVDVLAKMMNMSRATFYRKIKELSSLTPNELINIARLKKAAAMLAEGKYKVYEVADMIGYTLPTNFARDFNKQFGMSPSEYANSVKRP